MAKLRTIFVCSACGGRTPKWLGKCPECGEWGTLVEEVVREEVPRARVLSASSTRPTPLSEIDFGDGERRVSIGIGELDRVLGGGLVEGSAILIGGDPGIGKSTLVLQAATRLAGKVGKVIYVSGEESPMQIKMRAARLGIDARDIYVYPEPEVGCIMGEVQNASPSLVIIDSIQTVYSSEIPSSPGTVTQVRDSCSRLVGLAKEKGFAIILVGHVTKEGAIAGPKLLEHMVDTVLYFEGEKGHPFRILRAVKNRFGPTSEIGVFEMRGDGLHEVKSPSALFLAERRKESPGSVIIAAIEGTRPLLLEVQALVSTSILANPRRTAIGADAMRLALLVAVMEKVFGVVLHDKDIFLNVAGGLSVSEPAADLGIVASIYSSVANLPVAEDTVVIGEVGLGGEVRAVSACEIRVREAKKMGFKRAIVPAGNIKSLSGCGIDIIGVKKADEAFKGLF